MKLAFFPRVEQTKWSETHEVWSIRVLQQLINSAVMRLIFPTDVLLCPLFHRNQFSTGIMVQEFSYSQTHNFSI